MLRIVAILLALSTAASTPHERFLVTWAMESNTYPASGNGHDFLAIYEIGESNFGRLVSFVPTTTPSQMAHHVAFAKGRHRLLFANDFMAAQSYVFDINDPKKPAISAAFTDAGPYTHPHTFAQLSSGHILCSITSSKIITFGIAWNSTTPAGACSSLMHRPRPSRRQWSQN
jgi:hypothetical protein